MDYPLYAAAVGATPVFTRLGSDFALDVDEVRSALTQSTAAIVIANPNNPSGRTVGRDAWRSLVEILETWDAQQETAVTVIADETHRDAAWGAFASCAQACKRTLVVHSFGKHHCLQGQRAGYVAVSPHHPEREAVAEELERWSRILGMCTPNALMQDALPGR